MSVEIRQLKDANGYVFVPMTHWDAVSNKPDIALHSDILTKTSQLINDSSFVTEDDLANIDLSAYAKNASLQDVSARIPTLTSQLVNDSSFVTQQDLEDDEIVIAAAINELHDQIIDVSNRGGGGITYTAGNDIDISNGIISVAIGNASTLQEIVINYETRIAQLESTIATYEIRLQNLEVIGEIAESTENEENTEE